MVIIGGVDVRLEQIRRGMASHFKRYEREQSAQDRAVYASAEQEAPAKKLGLWRDEREVPLAMAAGEVGVRLRNWRPVTVRSPQCTTG